jgi:hypothetical protein
MQATQKRKSPRLLYACTVLTHILEVRPVKCGISAYSSGEGGTFEQGAPLNRWHF